MSSEEFQEYPSPGDPHDGGNIFSDQKEAREYFRRRLGTDAYQSWLRSEQLGSHPRPLDDDGRRILQETIAPLLHDLAITGMHLPDVREEAHHEIAANAVCAWIQEPDGGGTGITILTDFPPAHRVTELAEQLQEWAAEQLRDLGRPSAWPLCPQHRSAGPADPQAPDGIPVWICMANRHVISKIGSLTSLSRPD
jgi:hypothetical protein